jgi:hypothetical protein
MTASPLLAPPPLTGGEQRVVSVIVIGSPRHHAGAIGPTLVNEMVAVDWSALAALVTAHGGALEVLADGAAVVTFSGPKRIAQRRIVSLRRGSRLRESPTPSSAPSTSSGAATWKAPR